MGKTTVLTHFSRRIKEKNPNYWVMRFNLNDYTDILEEEKQRRNIEKRGSTEAIQFLRQKLLKLESTLEQRLFSEILEKKRIVVMFDGFDEVSPFYNKILLDLLADLRKSPIEQLWITTRPFLSKNLVNKLRPISCALQPFTSDNQLDFLVRFWRKSIEVVSDETKVKKFAENLIKRLSKSIDDNNRELASIPLQARMLAEAFDQDLIDFYHSDKSQPDLPRKFDLLDVYKRFSHRKYLIYIFEKNSLLKVNVAREDLATILSGGVNLRKVHQQLALQELFPEDKDNLLEFRKKRSLRPEQLNRIGIVQYEDERFNFVHRTFAEYYASDFFMSTLVKSHQPETSNPKDPFLGMILRNELYSVIRNFINGFLASDEFQIPEENLKFYGDKINRLSKMNWLIEPNESSILHIAIREGNFNIVNFLLNCLISAGHLDVLRKLYDAQDQYGKSIWLAAAEIGRVDIIEILWSTWKQINEEKITTLKSILMTRSQRQENAWSLSVVLNKPQIFDKILEYAKKVGFDPEELIYLVLFQDNYATRLWYSAAFRGQAWVFSKLFTFAKQIGFQARHFKKLMLTTNDFKETVWHSTACGNSIEIYYELRKWVTEAELELIDVKQILCSKDDSNESIWHSLTYYNSSAVQSKLRRWRKDVDLSIADLDKRKSDLLNAFWMWAKEIGLTANEIENELFAVNENGNTIWHLILEFRDEIISDKLVTLIKEDPEINSKEFFAELFARTYNGGTLWWKAIKSRTNFTLQMLWTWIREAELTPDQIKRMILEKDEGNTTLHFVTASYDVEMLENFWTYAKKSQLTEEDLKNLLFQKDNRGLTVWNSVIESDDLRMFDKLLKFLTKKFSPSPREFTDLLLEKRQFGCTWHQIFQWGRHRLLIRLLQIVDNQGYCRELISSKNEDDQTAFHLAACSRNSNVLEDLLEWLGKSGMTRDELESILSCKDRWDRTALVWAVKEKNLKAAIGLLKLGADIEDLDEKHCNSLKLFIQHRRSGNRDFLRIIEKRLEELLKRVVKVDRSNSNTDEEEIDVFDMDF